MRNLAIFLGTVLRMAVFSALISAVFCGIQWLLSLASICDAPTWDKFFLGGAAIFIVWFILSAVKTARIMMKK
jgi:hypothetical protein